MHSLTIRLKELLKWVKSPPATDLVPDARGRRFVAVIDCIFNQNAHDSGAARFLAMNFKLLELCHEYRVGVLQMPCPEIAALGFKRARKADQAIRDALDTEAGRQRCEKIASEVADRIEIYLAQGYELLAILGGNPKSPGCAVNECKDHSLVNSGVFMTLLQTELRNRNLEPLFKGIRDHDPELLEQDLQWFRDLLLQQSVS